MAIKIAVICGSVRPGNFTAQALDVVVDELKKKSEVEVSVCQLDQIALPFPGQSSEDPSTENFRQAVSEATGVILATPEYHGSFSSALKAALENLGFPSVLSGKPVGLLGVAGGAIGAIKSLEHLRSVCSHIGAIVLPGPVSIAGVNKAFDDQGQCTNPSVEKRLRGLATGLVDYIKGSICPKMALEAMVREKLKEAQGDS